MGSNIFDVQLLLLVNYPHGGVVITGVVCGCLLGICCQATCMCMSIWMVCMVCMILIATSIALSCALRAFWYPEILYDSWVLLLGLQTPCSFNVALDSAFGVFGGWDK